MKRIVILADGTWNSPEDGIETNILKLARAIKTQSDDTKQITFYDWGVGTDRKEFMGGLSGAGINKNIKDCYRFLVHNYEKGDELFFFGFSRGAFTVRSLAGFIRNCGVLKGENAMLIDEAFKMYKKREDSDHPNNEKAKLFRQNHAIEDITKIKFIGVFDTVGSLGIPLPFWGTLGEDEALFHDVKLSTTVQYARHALSIDENRKDFIPTLWEGNGISDLKQVWFSGVHSDVGGGYKETGLSDHALKWMIDEVKELGLEVEEFLKENLNPNSQEELHNERKGKFLLRPSFTRKMWKKEEGFIGTSVHASVKEKWENNTSYQERCKPLKKLLKKVNNDWSKIM